ncbi:hypothetical protein VSH64_11630 [Amycolatopsis rhabdoformis]|uniref:Uncharacterized protein n=1 Tax=Amycolatopsis rhabdoformis TaxID=1448059 RepID=A0ABZ1IGB1_9PSEU|nr:hypothetical protein [Amycolatopsis rhabdoformis]WSE32753.1 hypothetical protein VSH64_11630 [Amycolatopsis rhabdoformis]
MTDLDDLRGVLALPPAVAFDAVDLAGVMRRGRRRRRLRRLSAAAATVVVLVGVVVGAQLLRPPAEIPVTTLAVSAARPEHGAAAPIGAVVDTGVQDPAGEVVLFFQSTAALHDSSPYELVLGHRTPGGVTAELATGSRAGFPGFHALTAGRPGQDVPLFGYYTGPATRITAEVGGLMYGADTGRVETLSATVFWFPRRDAAVFGGASTLPMNAYSAVGDALPK